MIRKPIIPLATVAGAALLLLGACDRPPGLGPGEALFGNAVKTNIAAQTIADEPTTEIGVPYHSGQRASTAVRAYESDNVEPPAEVGTTDVIETTSE